MVVVVVISYLFVATAFTAATFSHFTGAGGSLLQVAALCIPSIYVASTFLGTRWRNVGVQFAAIASSVAMGFLNFASIAAFLCWPVTWLMELAGFHVDHPTVAWTIYGSSVPVAVYGLVNALTLRTTHYNISLPRLPPLWQGRRVALVSDVHVGNIFGRRYVARIVDRLRELHVDAVFICGDMFDGAVVDIADVAEPWVDFRAPAGVYFISGNHEEFGDRAPYLKGMAAAGVTVLDNEKIEVGGLQIVGVHDAEAHQRPVFQEILRRAGVDRDRPSILLVHRPGRLDVPADAGISLQLSGHTHAGQFPPFSLIVRLVYGKFGYGHHWHRSLQVVTSSGAGTGGPPFRVGTRSELVIIRLNSAGRTMA